MDWTNSVANVSDGRTDGVADVWDVHRTDSGTEKVDIKFHSADCLQLVDVMLVNGNVKGYVLRELEQNISDSMAVSTLIFVYFRILFFKKL